VALLVAKSKQVKNVSNLGESSKEGYGSKRADLPVMIMMLHLYDGILHLQETAHNTSAPVITCLSLEDPSFESRLF
jgi:hypothetical protein